MNSKRIYRQDRILAAVQENTSAMLEQPEEEIQWIHAGTIAQLLNMDRANVARELNHLYNDGQLIKVHGKPTHYICRSVLSQHYPNIFFPSTMPKGSRLSDYTNSSHASPKDEKEPAFSSLETQPGANGTLRSAVLYAKGAMMYPTRDLHTLIYGNRGAGKEIFAHRMYAHAVSKGRLSPDAPFVIVNCRGYGTSPQLLLSQLFGYSRNATPRGDKSHRGLIEKAAGGVLCLNGVEQLPTAVQDALIAVLEKNTYTRIGEASATRYANAMIIATSTEPPDAPSLAAFQQRFPIHIHIPDLKYWNIQELAEILIQTFQRESCVTGLSFRLPRETLTCFLQAPYSGNLSELFKTVRTACSLAFLDHSATIPRSKITDIRLCHLPEEFLHSICQNPEKEYLVQQLFLSLDLEYIDFSPAGFISNRFTSSQLMELLHREPSSKASEQSTPPGLAIALEHTRSYFQKYTPSQIATATWNDLLPSAFVGAIQYLIKNNPAFALTTSNSTDRARITTCLSDIAHHSLPKLDIENNPDLLSNLMMACPIESSAASLLQQTLEKSGITLSGEDIVYFIVSLCLTDTYVNQISIPILAVFHGQQIATDMAEYVNNALGCNVVTGINYHSQMSFDMLLEQVCTNIRKIDQGAGVLIAVDMEPLDNLHEHILRTTSIHSETVTGISLPFLLTISRLALRRGTTLHSLADQALSVVIGSTAQPESSFINRTVNELLAPSLTFLNPQKAIEILRITLDNFLKEFGIIPSSEIIIKFVFHCSHMLERLIRGAPLKYDGLKSFVNQHSTLMAKLEAHMCYPSEIFGVSIPASELAYVAEILLPYLSY